MLHCCIHWLVTNSSFFTFDHLLVWWLTAFIHPSWSLGQVIGETHSRSLRVSPETPSVHNVLLWEDNGASHTHTPTHRREENLQTHVSLMTTAWTGHTKPWQGLHGVPFPPTCRPERIMLSDQWINFSTMIHQPMLSIEVLFILFLVFYLLFNFG